MRRTLLPLSIVLLVSLTACARRKRVPAPPAAVGIGWTEEGIASWYGHPYHGRRASSGEIYDMEQLTAAHRTLPFGTLVRVRNLENERSVEVRINDRGPFIDGRIIDLSHAAAREIRMIGPGTAKVRVRVIKLAPATGDFAVQVGAFRERGNAERTRREMEQRYGSARLLRRDEDPPLWRVVVGHAATLEEAGSLAARIRAGGGPALVVRVEAGEGGL